MKWFLQVPLSCRVQWDSYESKSENFNTQLFFLGHNLGLQAVSRPRMQQQVEGEGGRKDKGKNWDGFAEMRVGCLPNNQHSAWLKTVLALLWAMASFPSKITQAAFLVLFYRDHITMVVFSKGAQTRNGLGWLLETSLRHKCWPHLFLPETLLCPRIGPLFLKDCERDQDQCCLTPSLSLLRDEEMHWLPPRGGKEAEFG